MPTKKTTKPAARRKDGRTNTAAGIKATPARRTSARRSLPAIWRNARRAPDDSPLALEPGAMTVGLALRGTGFIHEPDPRDANFPLGAVAGTVDGNPRSKSQVWQLPAHLLNQGSTNSCVGHACAHFILAAPRMGMSIDAIAIWHRAQELDDIPNNEGTNTGTSVRAGFKALREKGLITSDYRFAQNADDTLRFILNRGPVVVGTPWYPGMASPRNGRLSASGTADPNIGHAYLLFGFDGSRDAFLVANSWGMSWGTDGMGFLPFDDLQQLLQQNGTACSAVET